ncbi:MAG: tetratricopeptide repeat protein [Chitinophagaceae bacterium]|nr:tetratricopeptide repeat protein [Chitinophagaceae bacterium]
MSEQHQAHTESNDIILKAQSFWQKNSKAVLIFLVALIAVVGGWVGYTTYILKPKEDKAADAIVKVQEYFRMDSANLVLNGDGQTKGALYIINNYGGTKTANLAKFYAGVSYLHKGEFANAVKYLKDFSTDAKQVQLLAIGNLGDAYAELNQKEDAIAAYKKAADTFVTDENNSAEYLFRAALLSETTGKNKEALELYKELKAKYPKTDKGFQADKYIYRLSIEKSE